TPATCKSGRIQTLEDNGSRTTLSRGSTLRSPVGEPAALDLPKAVFGGASEALCAVTAPEIWSDRTVWSIGPSAGCRARSGASPRVEIARPRRASARELMKLHPRCVTTGQEAWAGAALGPSRATWHAFDERRAILMNVESTRHVTADSQLPWR